MTTSEKRMLKLPVNKLGLPTGYTDVTSVCLYSIVTGLQQLNRATFIKGIFRDHSRDNALNFYEIRDVCILVMVLDV